MQQQKILITEEKQLVGTTLSHGQSLIGREALLAEIGPLVVAQRLLTLTGPGGVGKTSIAQQLADRFANSPAFTAGVRWIDLAALSDSTAVPQAVAMAWGLAEQPGVPVVERLVGALQTQWTLLVLDNCEHLRAACAELCGQLLPACPQLHILATSREPLGLAAEMRLPIGPLADPAAIELFGLRATARLPSFAINDDTAPAIAAICVQLDGMPLAIELAAARITLLSATQIAERMEQSLNLLAGREAERPPRQRSLRAALGWSYTLLSADEQSLFRQLAVFAGSFDFDAVEAVCRVSAPLDALAELVDKSLIMVTRHAEQVRYRLHEVVRQYAAEQLQAMGEHRAAYACHLAWAVALAERAELAFHASQHELWLARLALEHENIRSALQRAEDSGDGGSMLKLAGALSQFWNSVSMSEGRAWLARGRRLSPLPPGVISVKAWNCESFLAYRQGDYEGMQAAATLALHEALMVEYAEGIAAARYRLGIYAEMKGATSAAREHYKHSLDLYRELGDQRGMSQTLNGLAHIAKIEGNPTEARQYYSQGLRLARAADDRLTTALLLISLANLTLDSGELDAAEAAYAESIVHLRAAANTSYLLYALNGLGEVARYRRNFATANTHYREGLQMARTLGLKDMEAQFLGHLGHTAIECQEYTEAARFLSEALRQRLTLERTIRTAGVVHSCADLLFRLGYPMQATTLFVAGLRAIAAEDFAYLGKESAELFAQSSAAARAALAPVEYALAVADGQALTLVQAADLALSTVYLPHRPLPAAPPPELRIFLFGQLRVERGGRELTGEDWIYSKTRDLLLFLLLVDSADKAEIGAALWPDASAEQIRQNFRMAIYHLRRALGRAEWITFTNKRYAFNRALPAWVDVAAFEQAVTQADSDPAQRTKQLRSAASLYVGDLALGELESDALLIRRERLRQQALEVLLAVGELYLSSGQYGAATETYRRALMLDSYGEAAHRGLLRSLARQGEGGAALAHYQRLITLLHQDLGVNPMAETTALAAQIQAGEAI